MVTNIVSVKPEGDADKSYILLDNGDNVAYEFARRLHAIADKKARSGDRLRKAFIPNVLYDLEGGLHFRLNDKLGAESPASIEFIVVSQDHRDKDEVLGQVPDLFCEIGIKDEKLLGEIRAGIGKNSAITR
jgi:hypothetical protein